MKSVLAIIFIFLINTFIFSPSMAAAENTYYARVLKEDVYLYKNTEDEKLFKIPASYFVELVGQTEEYYKVKYDSLSDIYIKKSDVSCVDKTPKIKYPALSLKIISLEGSSVRSSPYTSSKSLGNIDLYQSIKYFGEINGSEQVKGLGTKWFYVSAEIGGEIVKGYVYGGLCFDIISPTVNTETANYIENVNLQSIAAVTKLDDQKSFITLLVLGVFILIMFLLFLPKILAKTFVAKSSKTLYIKSSYDDDEF